MDELCIAGINLAELSMVPKKDMAKEKKEEPIRI